MFAFVKVDKKERLVYENLDMLKSEVQYNIIMMSSKSVLATAITSIFIYLGFGYWCVVTWHVFPNFGANILTSNITGMQFSLCP